MNKKGALILLIGPSGSGKGTVLKEVFKTSPNTFLSISATTRKPRVGESDGVNYFFITEEEFKRDVENNCMLEYACYCGNYYGTPKAAVLERIEKGENVILEIEVQGARQVKEMYPTAVTIFIIPPSLSELRKRLIERKTEDMDTVNKRLKTALEEINFAYDCDYIVVNDSILTAAEEVKAIISSQSCNINIMKTFIDEVIAENELL